MSINPVFDQCPNEGSAIGKIVVSFGELELQWALCAGLVLDGSDNAVRAIYRSRSTRGRIEIADALSRSSFFEVGIRDEYTETLAATYHCLRIRNQYAHCHWAPSDGSGVFFTDLEEAAEKHESFDFHYKFVDILLLNEQLEYFFYVKKGLLFLENEFRVKKGTLRRHASPAPTKQRPPILHRPESLHVPHWIP